MATWLLLISMAVVAISGMPGLVLPRRSMIGQWIAALLNVVGAAVGGAALILHHLRPELSREVSAAWALPLGRFAINVDDISLIFLIPMLLVPALGSIYGLGYWNQRAHPGNGRKLRACWGLLTASMLMVVVARDGILFLIAWEIMALAAFFLVGTEDNDRETRMAAWIYLAAAHVSALCLFGFFALLRVASGSFELWPVGSSEFSPPAATALFILGGVGFGLKAGLMPLHVWLPGAHANAPSHVSAILSGVLLKTGVYGLVRLAAILPHPPLWWGGTLLVAGALSAILGIAFAAAQTDLKRLLAYSSIENTGIITLGVGLATLGRTLNRADWVVLGLGGALLHVLNHGLFKPLLFMGAGAVVHSTRTRTIDLLGGLAKGMPRTFVMFLIGAVAICGLPPLNGFVGEFMLYTGFFRTVIATPARWGWVGLAAPALALVGALTIATFVKLVGIVFAGAPRSRHASRAHDPGDRMLVPMGVLVGCCILIGVAPGSVVGILDRAVQAWAPDAQATGQSIASYVPMTLITVASMLLMSVVYVGAWWVLGRSGAGPARSAGTWDCGYARPTSRMQYTGGSFSQMIVELLAWVLWPRQRQPSVGGAFPRSTDFASDVPDVVLDRSLLPTLRGAEWLLGLMRGIQRGPIQLYLLYVLAILLALLLFA